MGDLNGNRCRNCSNTTWTVRVTANSLHTLPPLGHIRDVMLVWRYGNIEKTVSVLQQCVIFMVDKGTRTSYRVVDCIRL